MPSFITNSGSSIASLLEQLFSHIDYISGESPVAGYFSNIPKNSTSIYNEQIDTNTGLSTRFYLDTYNNSNAFGSSLRGRRLRGTPWFPSGVQRDDVLLQLVGDGYNTTGIITRKASIVFIAEEDWTTSANGTYIIFRTTPTGNINDLERVRIDWNGNVGINNDNPLYKLDVSGAGNFTQGIYWNGVAVNTGVDTTSFATSSNLTQTGQTLYNYYSNLSGNLTTTGDVLDEKIDSLSGYVQNLIPTTSNLSWTGTSIAISFLPPVYKSINLSGNTTFTFSNLNYGRNVNVKIARQTGALVTMAFPAGITWLGSGAQPPSLATSKTGLLNLISYSNANNGIIAQWIAQK